MTAPPTPCGAWRESLRAYVDGELPPPERQAFEAHVASCAGCREALAETVRVVTRLDEALSHSTSSVRDAVVARLSRPAVAAANPEPTPAMKTSTLSHQSCPKCGAQ